MVYTMELGEMELKPGQKNSGSPPSRTKAIYYVRNTGVIAEAILQIQWTKTFQILNATPHSCLKHGT